MTMPISPRVSLSLSLASILLGLSACYTVDFDEQQTDIYYCMADDECLATQACSQFRCVDDVGPHVEISDPEAEPPTVFPLNQAAVNVTIDVTDLMLGEGNDVEDGFGKLLLTIDPHKANPITALVDTPFTALPLGAGLDYGPHRLVASAVYGDGTPYLNPSAVDHTVFFSSDGGPRPQVALIQPRPGHVHVANEPLEIQAINLGFDFVANGSMDCHVNEGCDPFDPNATCNYAEMGCTQITKTGHVHIYLRPDYPGCLSDAPINCNGDYIATVLPEGSGEAHKVRHLIEGSKFPEAGEFMLTVALQYSNHDPYPNTGLIIFDQIPITIVER